MSEECDRADCRSRAGLANLGSGRRLFVETSSGASIVPETARRFPVRRLGFGHPTRLRATREHRRRLRSLREPARGAQADRRCRHLRQHRRAVRQEYHRRQCGGAERLPRLPRRVHGRCPENARRAPGQAPEKSPSGILEPSPTEWSMASRSASGVMTGATWSGGRGIASSRPRSRTC